MNYKDKNKFGSKHIYLSKKTLTFIKNSNNQKLGVWSEGINACVDHIQYIIFNNLPRILVDVNDDFLIAIINEYNGIENPALHFDHHSRESQRIFREFSSVERIALLYFIQVYNNVSDANGSFKDKKLMAFEKIMEIV